MGLLRVVWGVLTHFGEDCSIAGLNNAAKARSRIRSCFWLIIYSVIMYYTTEAIVGVVVDFCNYPVSTTTDLNSRASV